MVCNEGAGEITVRLVKFMVSDLSMPLQSFTSDLSYKVLELYSEMEGQTAEFRAATGIPPGYRAPLKVCPPNRYGFLRIFLGYVPVEITKII